MNSHLEEAIERLSAGENIRTILADYPEEKEGLRHIFKALSGFEEMKNASLPKASALSEILDRLEDPVTNASPERFSLWGSISDTFHFSSPAWRVSGAALAVILLIVLVYPGKDGRQKVAEQPSGTVAIEEPASRQADQDIETPSDAADSAVETKDKAAQTTDEKKNDKDTFALIDTAFAADDESAYLSDDALGSDILNESDDPIIDNNFAKNYENSF